MRKVVEITLLLALFCAAIFGQARENPFGRGGDIFDEDGFPETGKSKWAAAGLSLLVPGAGELFLGDKRGAGYFLAAEGAIWGAYAGLTINGNWRKEEYRNYSAIHAGVQPEGKDDQFFEDVLTFESRDDFNNWYHLVYRDEVPLYPETEEYFWDWESEETWDDYADMRSSSETSFRNAKITLAVGLVNRVFSVVHVMRYQPEEPVGLTIERDGLDLRPAAYTTSAPDGRLSLGLGVSGSF